MNQTLITYAAIVISAILGLGGYEYVGWSDLEPSDWAAWLQAVGSVGAILVAVWVSADQQKKQRIRDDERDAEEVKHMLRSIRDEIWVTYDDFRKRTGKLFENSKTGMPFNFKIPLAELPFPVYEASVGKLGRVPSDELRKLVIVGYGRARGFILSIKYNNGLVERYEQADYMARAMNDDVHRTQLALIQKSLSTYGDALRYLYKENVQSVEELVVALDNYLNAQKK